MNKRVLIVLFVIIAVVAHGAPTCQITSPTSGERFTVDSVPVSGTAQFSGSFGTTETVSPRVRCFSFAAGTSSSQVDMTFLGSGLSRSFFGTVPLAGAGNNIIQCIAFQEFGLPSQTSGSCTTTVVKDVAVPPPTPPPTAVCGNRIIESGESCDDGNIINGDGCSSGCQVEAGFTCAGAPSICTRVVAPPIAPPTSACPPACDLSLIEEELFLIEDALDSLDLLAADLQKRASLLQQTLKDLTSALLALTKRVEVLEAKAGAPVIAAPTIAIAGPALRILSPTIDSTQQNPVQVTFVVENFDVTDDGNHIQFTVDDLAKQNTLSQAQIQSLLPIIIANQVRQFGPQGVKLPILVDPVGGVTLFMHFNENPLRLPDLADGRYVLRGEFVDANHNAISPPVEQLVTFDVKTRVAPKVLAEVAAPFTFTLFADDERLTERFGSAERERAKTGDALKIRNTGSKQ
ncbi:hypothetical protein HY490_04435, partial [Candidatus Woesearchaeota archaeon]|nr:hypothetical protein [Candidatus Woesearchaeota archaeon]